MTERELIQGCKARSPKAQRALYDQYAPVLMGIGMRYLKHVENAEDVVVEAFYKIFTKIGQYTGEGNFEGWLKRIMVNESLMFLRKNKKFKVEQEWENVPEQGTIVTVENEIAAGDILKLLDQLPDGYRTVFNLYVVEGYKHREIAELLGISINTSKSQLILAKKRMKMLVEQIGYRAIER